jgi:fused signal recognition particle receptor
MFGFLKKKLNDLFKKTEKNIEEKTEEQVKKEEQEKERKISLEISREIREDVEKLKKEQEEKKKAIEEKIESLENKKEVPVEVKESIKEYEEKKEEIEEKLKEIDEKEIEDKKEEKKQGFFSKIFKGFTTLRLGEESFDEFFNNLEEILIENNVAMEVIDFLRKKLKEKLLGKEIKKKEIEEEIKEALKEAISELLIEPFNLEDKISEKIKEKKPYVIVFFGINGSGKTTTIARLAYLLKKKYSVILAAADTFRAASIEQLEKHGENLKLEVIKSKYGADPASVIFDAIAHAKAKGIDIVLADTAGRMHTKQDLLREMEKIVRVSKPDLKVFVAESTTGNDAVEQAKAFNDSIGIDALILTKADVDERGGAMISVSHVTGKPILFLGMGQEYKDLEVFNKKKILDKLFS